jgi:penicillin G amidase
MRRNRSNWSLEGEAQIRIDRDEHGVPHVHASSAADLYRGLGYCHGRDRALQALLTRILVWGRGGELLETSEEMLSFDRFFRRLGFAHGAEELARSLPEPKRALLGSYCDGLNQALRRSTPWELRLARYGPAPWTAADTIMLTRAIGYVQIAQHQAVIERLLVEMVQGGVSERQLEELFPGLLDGLDMELLREVRLGERNVPDGVRWGRLVSPAIASNGWVIGPAKTASGFPVLANDPHLEVNRLPAVWYEVVLEQGERFCAAATMPGVPGPLIGRTSELAWGATYSCLDAVDSWVEECRDGRYRRFDGEERWLPFERRTETICRRGKPPVELTVYENEHGVLDGDPSRPGLYLATRWAAGDAGANAIAGIFDLFETERVEDAMEIFGRFEISFNWLIADRDGDIGYQMSGRMPVRRDGWSGLFPAAGWDPSNDWDGFAPPTELPRVRNPEAGFIATSNDDLNHLGRLHPVTAPMGNDRGARINELLARREGWTVGDIREMQLDVYSGQAERFLGVLGLHLPPGPAGDVLRRWDRRYDLGSEGASAFEAFYAELLGDVVGGVCGDEVIEHLLGQTSVIAGFFGSFDRVLLDERSAWHGEEGRDAAFARAAERALARPAEPWGVQQRFVMRHLMFGGRVPRKLGFDRGPYSLPGGRATIQQGQIFVLDGRKTTWAPSYRLVADLSEDVLHTVLAGGPSDRRFSRWYASGLEDWLAGRLKRLRPLR